MQIYYPDEEWWWQYEHSAYFTIESDHEGCCNHLYSSAVIDFGYWTLYTVINWINSWLPEEIAQVSRTSNKSSCSTIYNTLLSIRLPPFLVTETIPSDLSLLESTRQPRCWWWWWDLWPASITNSRREEDEDEEESNAYCWSHQRDQSVTYGRQSHLVSDQPFYLLRWWLGHIIIQLKLY